METTPPRILIVESDENVLEFLVEFLQFRGYLVTGAGNWEEAEGFLSKRKYNLLIFSFEFPKEEGALITSRLAELAPEATLIVLTYPQRLAAATSVFEQPIFQFVVKPISDYEKFEQIVRQALDFNQAAAERKQLEMRVEDYSDRIAKLTNEYNQRLRDLERHYRTLVENGQDAILILNSSGEVLDANQNACSHIGLSRQELIGSNVCQSDLSDKLNNLFIEVLDELKSALECQFETEINRRDGSPLPVKVIGLVIAAQRPPQYVVYIRDISEIREQRLHFQLKLRQLGEQISQYENQGFNPGVWFKQIFSTTSLFAAILDKDGLILDWNPFASQFTGYSRQDAFSSGFIIRTLPTQAVEILEFCADLSETRETNLALTDADTITAEGQTRALDLHLTRLRTDSEAEIILLMGMDSTTGRRLREVLENHVHQLKRSAVERTKELLLTQERLTHLFNGSLDPLFEADETGRLTDVNPAWLKLTGYPSLREVQGRYWLSFFALSENERSRLMNRLNEQGYLRNETCEFIRSDGSKLSALLTVTRQPSFDQERILYEGSLRDVSTLKQLEAKLVEYSQNLEDIIEQRSHSLAQSEAKFRRLADNAPDIIYQIDAAELSFKYLSPAAERITGYSLAQLYAMGQNGFLTHIHPADVQNYLDHWSRMVDPRQKTGEFFSMEYRFVKSNGSVIWFADRGMPVTSGTGALLSVEGILQDITELRSATEKLSTQTELLEAEVHRRSIKLQESENRYQLLLAEAGDIIFTTDARGRILDLNQRGRDLIGMKPEEINLKGFPNLLEENYRKRFNRTLRQCVEKGIRPDPYHIEYINPRGRRLQLEIQSSPFILEDKVIMVLHVARDLTARRRSVQAIRTLKERNEEMIRTMSEGILIENEEGVCEFVNPALAEMLGYTGAEMVGRSVIEFVQPAERDYYLNQIQVRHLRGTTRFETNLITTEGSILPVMISSRARYADDRDAGALSVITNLTTAKELERRHKVMERLLEDERKLADIGMLAAGIAHNINNPLTSINGFLELIRARYPDCAECDAVAQQLDKIEAITKNLMVKSRSEQEKQIRPINLNDLITTELKFLEANLEFKSKVRRTVDLDPDLTPVKGVYSDFSQVFSNLVNNALDAMFGRDDKRLRIATRLRDKELWIEVEDNGKGIAPEHLDRIFTPFFTTKPPVSEQKGNAPVGTGLGLSTAQQLIAHYGGRIIAESELEKRTLFRIILPAPEKIETILEPKTNAYLRIEADIKNDKKELTPRDQLLKDAQVR